MNPFSIVEIIGKATDSIANIFDESFTSKEEKIDAKNRTIKIVNEAQKSISEHHLKEQEIQAETIKTEMEGNWLQRSWRPILALMFGFIVVCNFFIFPVVQIFLRDELFAKLIEKGQSNENFWNLLFIMIGGYTVGRSAEKVAEKVKKK